VAGFDSTADKSTDGIRLKTTPGDTLHVAPDVVRDVPFEIVEAML
jgi:hypothetical protein